MGCWMAKSDDWGTPPDLIDTLKQEFNFSLEVCAAEGNQALPYLPYMGLDNGQDALLIDWMSTPYSSNDVCFINPPYSMLPAFVKRMGDQTNGFRTIVALIPAYTDTKYFQDDIRVRASEVRLLKGRLRFWLNGEPGKETARFPSAVVIYRPTKGLGDAVIRWWDWKA